MPNRKINHIYWFAYYNLDSPSVRYRAKYPLDFAKEKLGISSSLVLPGYSPKRLWNFITGYIAAMVFPKKNSLIVIQRVRSNFIYSNLLKLLVLIRKKRTVYDLDDADYLEHNPGTIHFFARNCNYLSAGSPAIAQYLIRFNRSVFHITSPTPDYGIVKKARKAVFTVGWVGNFGWGHKDSLYTYLFPALKELKFECRLIMIGITQESDKKEICRYLEDHSNIKVVLPSDIDWHDEKWLQNMIRQFDVGIATLLNHPIQTAKSGIKAKQYMNNGIPVICNDLPENKNVVIDNFNGRVCHSVSAFSKRLIEFKNMDAEHYWQYSRNARSSAEHFNHWKYFEVLEQMKNGTKQ
ncbi:MAG: glycosyltransferase [Bacteroidales bacterium]|nr:glycosyltransferase [Bacteroidales bacterium]